MKIIGPEIEFDGGKEMKSKKSDSNIMIFLT